MIELLKLCGYDEKEDQQDIQRAQRAFKKLGITKENIERAKQNIARYYDIELQGIRKMLGVYVRDAVNLVLAREDGRTMMIYAMMAEGFDLISSAFTAKSDKIYVSWPESTFEILCGPTFFDNQVTILEAAEALWLKEGIVSHCGNVKMLVGLLALDLIPKPDMLVVQDFYVINSTENMDLLHEIYGAPLYYFGTCLDREDNESPEAEAKRVALAASHMRELVENMQKDTGIQVTEEDLWGQIEAKKILKGNMARLHEVLDSSDNPPISASHGSVIFLLQRLSSNHSTVSRLIETTSLIYDELKDRVNKGIGKVAKGAPRIQALNPVSFTDPRLEHMIEELGMWVTTEIDLFWPDGRRMPDVKKSNDPYIN
jgi:hypothetical protein